MPNTPHEILPVDATEIEPPRRRPGRPRGATTRTVAAGASLGTHHFQFLRGLVDEIDPADLWDRYMAFTGSRWDARGGRWRTGRLVALVREIAIARGSEALAAVALHPARLIVPDPVQPPGPACGASPSPAPPSPVLPSLSEWVDVQIAEADARGEDLRDFYSEKEWLALYEENFGLNQAPPPRLPATALPHEPPAAAKDPQPPPLAAQVAALRKLEPLVVRPVQAEQPVSDWFTPNITRALNVVGVLCVGDLVAYIGIHGFRWNRKVRGVGATLAKRITAWAVGTAEKLQTPLPSRATVPASIASLSDTRALAESAARRFAIVPLDRLYVPSDWDGHDGVFRQSGPNTLSASTDLEAIVAWLAGHRKSPRTFVAYGLAAERFYLWSLFERRKPLSSLDALDIHAYSDFLANPPAHWVMNGHAARTSSAWLPLRGAQTPVSRNHALTIIGAMLSALRAHGYLAANPAVGVRAQLKLPKPKVNFRRSFTEQQWHCVVSTLDRRANTPQNRRLRLILELGSTSGLRRSEIASARYKDLEPSTNSAGERVWLLHVTGKGGKPRTVMVFDDIKAMIDAHHGDMQAQQMGHDPRVTALRSLDPNVVAAPETCDPGLMPLVGALRKAPPRWRQRNGSALPSLDRAAPTQSDAYAALDPGAMYQAFKRLLRDVAAEAEKSDLLSPEDTEALRRSSTHWMRHFFANNAVADGASVEVLRDALGHSDIKTTSVYLRAETKAIVELISSTRRRR